MKPSSRFSARYEAALRGFLKSGPGRLEKDGPEGSWDWVRRPAGTKTSGLVTLHVEILLTRILPESPPEKHAGILRRAGEFFVKVLEPTSPKKATVRAKAGRVPREVTYATLQRQASKLAANNRELRRGIAELKGKVATLKKQQRTFAESLRESDLLKEQLRHLSRGILVVQEEERKTISRELHDVIAQLLVGVNVHLAALKREATLNSKGVHRNIAVSQRLVLKSAAIVHDFARNLRPAVLDDLGLAPALRSYLKSFETRTGLATHMSAMEASAKLDPAQRTIFFRVAQEALTNIARHAEATRVDIRFKKDVDDTVRMTVKDNGKSFDVPKVMRGRSGKRLGLLGMRERLEMAGGKFHIESKRKEGTTLTALLPMKPEAKANVLKSA